MIDKTSIQADEFTGDSKNKFLAVFPSKISSESVDECMERYFPKNDEETRMVDDIAIVRASYPLADSIFGRVWIERSAWGIYELGRGVEGARLDLIGAGRNEEEAWYSAATVIQQIMLMRLAR